MADNLIENHNLNQSDNLVRKFGMEMHNPVFFLSAALILLFSVLTLIFPEAANSALNGAKAWTLQKFDWFYAVTPILILVICIGLALSPLGKIRLGGKEAKPEYGVGSWIAMLFAAGVGIGFMFYGAAEPLGYYTNWFGTPFNTPALSAEARRLAFTTTVFHWGLFAWSVYAIVGLSLAFFAYNKGLPLTIRSAFYPLLGDKIWGWPGHLIDLFAVVSTIFGLACTIGIGATQATSGLAYMFEFTPSKGLQIGLIFVITIVAIGSVLRGMNGGIKLLSNINMVGATALLIFIIIAGPTIAIFKSMGVTTLYSIPDSLRLANWIGRPDEKFMHDWTIFYWAWWIAWSPFVGMFIARISKGRTIRQFMSGVLLAPLAIGIVWFTAFGEAAMSQLENKVGDLAGGMGDSSLVLFQMLNSLPIGGITSMIAIILLIIFIVTSADSGALVVDSLTSGGQTNSPVFQRVFWAAMLGLTAIALLYGGGDEALKALQAGTITAALPFTIIVLLFALCLLIGLRAEAKESDK
jgi:BCCT family betaine/carnitine transporter